MKGENSCVADRSVNWVSCYNYIIQIKPYLLKKIGLLWDVAKTSNSNNGSNVHCLKIFEMKAHVIVLQESIIESWIH